jgi:hypothetical protein
VSVADWRSICLTEVDREGRASRELDGEQGLHALYSIRAKRLHVLSRHARKLAFIVNHTTILCAGEHPPQSKELQNRWSGGSTWPANPGPTATVGLPKVCALSSGPATVPLGEGLRYL